MLFHGEEGEKRVLICYANLNRNFSEEDSCEKYRFTPHFVPFKQKAKQQSASPTGTNSEERKD